MVHVKCTIASHGLTWPARVYKRALLFSGLDYWTGKLDLTIGLLVFAHSMVGFVESC